MIYFFFLFIILKKINYTLHFIFLFLRYFCIHLLWTWFIFSLKIMNKLMKKYKSVSKNYMGKNVSKLKK